MARWFVQDDLQEQLCKSRDELFNLISLHFRNLFAKLKGSFDLGYFCFFAKEGDEAIDILIVVLDNLSIFKELLFLLGSTAFGLEEGGGELAKDVGILSHEYASCFNVFLFVADGLHLVFLHMNQRIISIKRSLV